MNLRKQLELLQEFLRRAQALELEARRLRTIARRLASAWDSADRRPHRGRQMRLDGDLPGGGPPA